MFIKTIEALIAGQEINDQNDDGFYVELKNSVVEFQICPEHCENPDRYTVIKLPYSVCKEAFEQIKKNRVYFDVDS